MTVFAGILFVWTAAMLALHVASRPILRSALREAGVRPRRLSVAKIVRFEGLYYLALLAYWWFARADFPLLPLMVLGVIHVGGWALAEAYRPALVALAVTPVRTESLLRGIQIFDFAEAAVLVFIGWKLVLSFF